VQRKANTGAEGHSGRETAKTDYKKNEQQLTGGGTDVGPAKPLPPPVMTCVTADCTSDSSVGPLNGSDSEPGNGSWSPSIVVCE